MKKLILTILFSTSALAFSQHADNQALRVSPRTQKEYLNKLTPEQRKDLVRQYRKIFLIEDLRIPEADKQRFSTIYDRYQQEQKQIKEEFNGNFDPEKLSDKDARRKLSQSFITGQKLLDNRKKYAEEMQSVLKPQQVLKMFRNEGRMRDKIRESTKKIDSPHTVMRDPAAVQNAMLRNLPNR